MSDHRIRALFTLAGADLAARESEWVAAAAEIRGAPGCLEFDLFRDIHFPECYAQVELWEDGAAFDAFRRSQHGASLLGATSAMCAPCHKGLAAYPRRHGLNGVEFYPQRQFQRVDGVYYAAKDAAQRIETLRLPTRSDVRVIIQLALHAAMDDVLGPYSDDTRRQPGCAEFAWLRSLSFPENVLHLELWDGGAAGYDAHYLKRTLQDIWGGMFVPRPDFASAERRYGESGFEFYQHCFYAPVDGVWLPENPGERMLAVQWY